MNVKYAVLSRNWCAISGGMRIEKNNRFQEISILSIPFIC